MSSEFFTLKYTQKGYGNKKVFIAFVVFAQNEQ